MNEKEAREIVSRHYKYAEEAYEKYDVKIGPSNQVLKAEGYLEAIEKAKALETALKDIKDHSGIPIYQTAKWSNYCHVVAFDSLVEWEKEK